MLLRVLLMVIVLRKILTKQLPPRTQTRESDSSLCFLTEMAETGKEKEGIADFTGKWLRPKVPP